MFNMLGAGLPDGAPSLIDVDVSAWRAGRRVWAPWLPVPAQGLIVILRGMPFQDLPPDVVARIVAVIDMGLAIDVWAEQDAEIEAALHVIAPWLGGAHV
jgi:hypothetical protein